MYRVDGFLCLWWYLLVKKSAIAAISCTCDSQLAASQIAAAHSEQGCEKGETEGCCLTPGSRVDTNRGRDKDEAGGVLKRTATGDVLTYSTLARAKTTWDWWLLADVAHLLQFICLVRAHNLCWCCRVVPGPLEHTCPRCLMRLLGGGSVRSACREACGGSWRVFPCSTWLEDPGSAATKIVREGWCSWGWTAHSHACEKGSVPTSPDVSQAGQSPRRRGSQE